jgi:hypothetical protein
MLSDISSGRRAEFDALATTYGVTHAVGMGAGECEAMAAAGLASMYRFGEVCVFSRTSDPVR